MMKHALDTHPVFDISATTSVGSLSYAVEKQYAWQNARCRKIQATEQNTQHASPYRHPVPQLTAFRIQSKEVAASQALQGHPHCASTTTAQSTWIPLREKFLERAVEPTRVSSLIAQMVIERYNHVPSIPHQIYVPVREESTISTHQLYVLFPPWCAACGERMGAHTWPRHQSLLGSSRNWWASIHVECGVKGELLCRHIAHKYTYDEFQPWRGNIADNYTSSIQTVTICVPAQYRAWPGIVHRCAQRDLCCEYSVLPTAAEMSCCDVGQSSNRWLKSQSETYNWFLKHTYISLCKDNWW